MKEQTGREKVLREQLLVILSQLHNATVLLGKSYSRCAAIGMKPEYDDDELESFDAFTGRFARASDIFTQKASTALTTYLQQHDSLS